MSLLRQRFIRAAAAVLVGGLALAATWSRSDEVAAQAEPGEYGLIQGGTVGWVYVSPDRTAEWWAYIEGSYEWADKHSNAQHQWQLGAEYMGAPCYASFEVWKAVVRTRTEAQGQVLLFQRHSVQEEVVQN